MQIACGRAWIAARPVAAAASTHRPPHSCRIRPSRSTCSSQPTMCSSRADNGTQKQQRQEQARAEALPAAAGATATPQQQQQQQAPSQQQAPEDDPELVLILLACGIGLATGAAIVAFNLGIHAIRDVIWHPGAAGMAAALGARGADAEADLWPKVVFPPLLGGLAVGTLGLLIGGYEDSAGGGGGGRDAPPLGGAASWRQRLAAVVRPTSRALAATITLGTGASLGPEGPSVDVGRSVARGLGAGLRGRTRHLLQLLAAGSGAGVAAGFNAPIAGVFFAVETVLQKQQASLARLAASGAPSPAAAPAAAAAGDGDPSAGSPALPRDVSAGLGIAMVLLASVLAAVVSQAGLGSSPAFRSGWRSGG